MIDRELDRPLHKQLADLLRDQIHSGELPPGTLLPSETYLGQTHDLSRTAVRRAVEVLLHEGLVSKSKGRRTSVREQVERRLVVLGAGDEVDVRMPAEAERRQLGMPIGEPIIAVRRAGGEVELYAGASTTLRSS